MSVEDEIERIDSNIDALVALTSRLKDSINSLEARINELEADVAESRDMAASAYSVMNQQVERADGGLSKIDVARCVSRNELVKRAILDASASAGGGLVVGDVQKMAKPEVTLYPQTVYDAWEQLVDRWQAFSVGENEAGHKQITLRTSEIPEELARVVQQDLGRDDLVKRLLSGRTSGGGF